MDCTQLPPGRQSEVPASRPVREASVATSRPSVAGKTGNSPVAPMSRKGVLAPLRCRP